MNKLLLILTLLILHHVQVAYANELMPPKKLEYGDKSYKLTSAAKILEPHGERLLFRYTTDNETKDQWTSMVIIQFSPRTHLKDETLAKDIKSYYDASSPRPYYSIDFIGGKPFARHLNPPINDQLSESSVMRFFSDGCGGQVVFQYLEKVDASNVQNAFRTNELTMRNLAEYTWQPECVVDR